jgi:hypothetical protein
MTPFINKPIMKKFFLLYLVAAMSLLSQSAFSQTETDTSLLGLAGDNLDLYAVLDLFQKSKTIEEFEKSLNEQKAGINNMDLDLDKKVDFIKVVTKQKDSSFSFILQIAVSEKETQDVAVILLDKDKKGKVTMQIVGDKELYGNNYVVEPKPSTPSVTPNPGYVGPEPVTVKVEAAPTTVVVQSAPIVQYVYSPAYVPYYPPYYYGFYPPYFAAFSVMAVGIYRANHYYHGGYGGGYGYHNTTIIHNENNFNNYNGDRNTSDRVSHNKANGSYGDGRGADRRSSGASASTRPAGGGPSASTRPAGGGPSASTRPAGGGPSASTRPSTTPSTRQSGGASASTRPSTSNYSSSGRTRSSGGYSGGGYSGGGGGGGMRGGGGGGRRR